MSSADSGRDQVVESGDTYFQTESQLIINNDLFLTETVGDDSIDLIVTSPPYNVDIGYNSHDDRSAYSEYMQFNRKWLARCYGWLKSD